MIIIKSNQYEFVGFDKSSSLYEFKSTRSGQTVILRVDQAKVVDKSNNVVIFLKQGGLIEPSFSSQKKLSDLEGYLTQFTRVCVR